MKQNYNLLTSSTAFPHAWNSFFQKSKKHAGSLLVVLFMLFGFSDAFGQVAIIKPNLNINTCVFPSAYSVLGQIQIQESNNGDFANQGNGRTIVLTAPANFEFNPGVGTLAIKIGRASCRERV